MYEYFFFNKLNFPCGDAIRDFASDLKQESRCTTSRPCLRPILGKKATPPWKVMPLTELIEPYV
jgi:hypothetical protein